MGNIVGEPFKDYVAKQINVRQEVHGSGKTQNRTPEQIQYLNGRNAWVKLASGTSMEQSRLEMIFGPGTTADNLKGTGLARNFILFNGVRNLNQVINEDAIKSIRDVTNISRQDILTENNTSRDYQPRGQDFKIGDALSYSWGAQRSGIGSDGAYGLGGNEFGQVPMPGIESVNITNLDRGSIKKATIQLKAHNKQQFDIIDALYLRLGYTILLEYGDSNYFDNNGDYTPMGPTLIEKEFFRNSIDNKPYLTLLDLIEKEREAKAGNYGGLFGKIANFKWTFNPDGSYSITLDVLSLGDVIESLKINTANLDSNEGVEEIEGELEGEGIIDSNRNKNAISNFFYNIRVSSYRTTTNEDGDEQILTKSIKETIYIQTQKLRKSKNIPVGRIVPPPNKYEKLFPKFNKNFAQINFNNSDLQWFLTFESLLTLLNKLILPTIKPSNSPQIRLDSNPDANLMYFIPNMVSLDPSVCVINNEGVVTSNPSGEPIFQKLFTGLRKFQYTPNSGENTYGNIMSVYLNFSFIIQLLNETDQNGNIALIDFLRKVCNGINRSLGGVNKLEPKIYEEENIIRIVDQTPLPGKSSLPSNIFPTGSESYMFDLYGYNNDNNTSNFIHNVGITTEITPEYATMITVGSTANGYVVGEDATAFSKWNTGIVDRFKQEIVSPSLPTPANLDDEEALSEYQVIENNYVDLFNKEGVNSFIFSGFLLPDDIIEDDTITSIQDDANKKDNIFKGDFTLEGILGDENERDLKLDYPIAGIPLLLSPDNVSANINVVSEFYRYLQAQAANSKEADKKSSGQTGFLPFNLQLDMDGIEGMKIYNKINVNTKFLASNYKDSMEFVLTGVRHKLENNQWVTSLDSIATVTNLLSTKDLQNIDISLSNLVTTAGTVNSVPGRTTVNVNNSRPIIISTDNKKQKDIYKNSYKYTKEFVVRKGNNNPNSNVTKFVNFLSEWKSKNLKVRIIIKSNTDTNPGGQLGNGGDITEDLLNALSKLHIELGKDEYTSLLPITITAGNDLYHQGKTVGSKPVGVETKSQAADRMKYPTGKTTPSTTTHTRGLAIDIRDKKSTPLNNLVIQACKNSEFTGVKFHAEHTHANIDPDNSIINQATKTATSVFNTITNFISS